jgi:hypothetical protein
MLGRCRGKLVGRLGMAICMSMLGACMIEIEAAMYELLNDNKAHDAQDARSL